MPITYDMINNALMTSKQCTDLYQSSMDGFGIFALIAVLIMAGFACFFIIKYVRLKQFIKENKLEKKYQEFRKDNKGLD